MSIIKEINRADMLTVILIILALLYITYTFRKCADSYVLKECVQHHTPSDCQRLEADWTTFNKD